MAQLHIYTDGAHSSKTNTGGWAYLIIDDANNILHQQYDGEVETTNNRMEMTAVAEALQYIADTMPQVSTITICVDSAYVCNAFVHNWIATWLNNGWKTTSKSLVKNKDLWQKMIKLIRELEKQYKIIFTKVEGHSTNKYNNIVDKLAVQGRKEANK